MLVKLTEPFTPDQVASINEYQHSDHYHPFTCRDGDILIATETGMECSTCGHKQDWVHAFMANWSWKTRKLATIRVK